ncbi:unnamed protein product [Anisakis simplex]|uniref:SapB/AmfS family lantipeptide n=1 Tax=Anisakis simplex TaxID=6269 RepID=A0A0M3JQ82_ANISI|nr:unnamed protein product [Anisakis simplex]
MEAGNEADDSGNTVDSLALLSEETGALSLSVFSV